MLARTACFCRCFSKEAKSQNSLDVLKKKADALKANSEPYIKEMEKKLAEAKSKSSVRFTQFIDWSSNVINKTTGYDQITEMEKAVIESERVFEKTTQELRDLNATYMSKQQKVMQLQLERSGLLAKPKRTTEENKRLAELVANENEWEVPLESLRKDYQELFEIQKKQLEDYKEKIYKRYYEERAWEQKIRRLGQYSYIAMLFLNVLTFCYTRYDRKRIRKNMENTISSNNALSKQIESIQATQEQMWAETNQTLQEIHKFVSEKPQDASREVKGVTEVQADDQTVAQREERKEIANENQENDFKANEAVVPSVPPVVNEVVTEDSEYKLMINEELLVVGMLALLGLFGFHA